MDNLENLSPFKKNAVLVLPVLFIVAFSVIYLLIPLYDTRVTVNAEVERQRADLAKSQQQIDRLSVLRAENDKLKKELAILEAQLPLEKEISPLLKQVSDLGMKSGLETVLWRPGGRVVHPSNEVYEIPVSVEMRGSYHNYGYFLSKITELPRIVNMNNITLKSSGKGTVKGPSTLAITFSARTYSALTEEEKKAIAEAAKRKK